MSDEELLKDMTALLQRGKGIPARLLAELFDVEKRQVNRLLYSHRERFVQSDDARPIWFVYENWAEFAEEDSAQAELPNPSFLSSDGPALDLHDWQEEALERWQENAGRGIIEAVTGAGKTRLALAAIDLHIGPGRKAAVIVPTVELLSQWTNEIAKFIPRARIGFMGNGNEDTLADCDILVAIINSARKWELGLAEGESGLLIADECHRFGSDQNQLALEESFEFRMGLSATYERGDGAHLTVLIPYFGDVVYSIGFREAIDAGIIAEIRVATIGVNFSEVERRRYDALSDELTEARRMLVSRYGLHADSPGHFFDQVSRLAKSGEKRKEMDARRFLSPHSQRRTLLSETSAKLDALHLLFGAISDSNGTLLFTQTIESCDLLVDRLLAGKISATVMHSKLKPQERRERFDAFAGGRLKALTAPQVLDEGVDVPEADLGVIIAATSQRRQMIQRMGRVVRKKADGRQARFVIIYVRDTLEDPANGAHEAFFDELLEVASKTRRFNDSSRPMDLRAFLQPHES